MRLTRIELENFRLHGHSVLEIGDGRFCVVKGDHYAGKTTIGQAISMAMVSTTMGLDAQGRLFERKIKRGELKAVVTVDIQAKHKIRRRVVLNTNTSGRTADSKCLDDEGWKPLPFENYLTRYKDALMVVCNTDYFLRMGEKEQKNLLAKLVLPERYAFPQEKIDAVGDAIGFGVVSFDGEPFAVIAAAHKKLFEERTIVNRQVKEFDIPESLPLPNGVNSGTLQEELDNLRAEQAKLRKQCDAAVDKEADKGKRRARLQSTIESLRAEVTAMQAKIEAAKDQRAKKEDLNAARKRAEGAPKLKELKAEESELRVKIRTKESELKDLDEVPIVGSECPTCGQVIEEEKLKAYAVGLAMKRHEWVAQLNKVTEEINDLGDVDGATSLLARENELIQQHNQLETWLQEKIATGKKTRADLDLLGTDSDPRAEFTTRLDQIEKDIAAKTEALRPVIAAEERKGEIARKTAALEKIKARAAVLDGLVEYFGKDGIKANLIAEHIGGFESKANAVLGAWGYKINLSLEPWELLVTTARGDTVPVTELSGAEELWFSVAIQCAVSRVAGIGFVVADKMDELLPKYRPEAAATLAGMIEDGILEQVFVIVADDKKTPAGADVTFFVEDGRTVRL